MTKPNLLTMNKGGYHKGNFYLRVFEMQQEYLKYANSGRTTKYIYETYIYPRFHISRATFYSWLAINARAGLKQLESQQNSLEQPLKISADTVL